MEKKDRIDLFFVQNRDCFPVTRITEMRESMEQAENAISATESGDYRNPTTMLIISILIGELGVDRFMIGEVGMGILKLLTGGCCGILWIIDIINIKKKTQEYNYNKFKEMMLTAR